MDGGSSISINFPLEAVWYGGEGWRCRCDCDAVALSSAAVVARVDVGVEVDVPVGCRRFASSESIYAILRHQSLPHSYNYNYRGKVGGGGERTYVYQRPQRSSPSALRIASLPLLTRLPRYVCRRAILAALRLRHSPPLPLHRLHPADWRRGTRRPRPVVCGRRGGVGSLLLMEHLRRRQRWRWWVIVAVVQRRGRWYPQSRGLRSS